MATINLKGNRPASQKRKNVSVKGAPAQYNKTGRKGTRAWRKNVDIEDVEAVLDEIRVEEETIGLPLQKHPNDSLFAIDATGDDAIRKTLPPKFTYAQKLLSQRSAISALKPFREPESEENRRSKLSYQKRERLLRIAGRSSKGPLGTIRNPRAAAADGVGPASEGKPPTYDLWNHMDAKTAFVTSLKPGDQRDYLPSLVIKPVMKPPLKDERHESISLKAVMAPHMGLSYNPPAEAHRDLLRSAIDIEQKLQDDEDKANLRLARGRVEAEVVARQSLAIEPANGMPLDLPGEEAEELPANDPQPLKTTKEPKRKSKKARTTATRLKIERHARLVQLRRKRLLHEVNFTKQAAHAIDLEYAIKARVDAQREAQEKLVYRNELAGMRFGTKHPVPKGTVEVQLSEDLSENLRGLKVEGNLVRDRFLNLQQRGLVESRPLYSGRRSKGKYKTVEKRAWREFV